MHPALQPMQGGDIPLGVKHPCHSCLVREGAFLHGFRELKLLKYLRAPVTISEILAGGGRRSISISPEAIVPHRTRLGDGPRVPWFWSNSLILSSQMPHKTGHISQWPCKDSQGNRLNS